MAPRRVFLNNSTSYNYPDPVRIGTSNHQFMKAFYRPALIVLSAALYVAAGIQTIHGREAQPGVDWKDFLSRHDLVWNSLPRDWNEAAFIGNGLLGATIYAGNGGALQWDVGRSDVTDRGERIAIGRFALAPKSGAWEGEARLDLWNAEARGVLRGAQGAVEWRSLTHAEKLVSVIELTDHSQQSAKMVFQPLPAISSRADYQKTAIPEAEQNPGPVLGETNGINWCRQSFRAGGGYVVAWGERELAPGHRLFFFTVDYAARGEPVPDKAVADIQAALQSNFDDLVASHRAWWHAYYPQSFVSFPDTRMESFYWIQMYKLAAATRADRPALDLMGPWFRRTPWPKIWWNLNIQLTYWPVYAANRLELGESLTRMIDAHRQNLISNVPAEWRADSAAIGRSSSYDCARSLKGNPGEERGDLTWVLHNYWLQYRFSGDEALLRDGLYPMLKRSIAYYGHLLKKDADGRLHLPVSLSPEYPKTAPDTSYDLSLLRWGLNTLLAINDRLGLNDSMAATWRDTLANLAPVPVDAQTGYMIGAGQPFAESHRHYSHLFSIYPLHLVDPQSAADRPLIEKSLDHWKSMPAKWRGYSYTGSSAMSSWLGRKDDAVSLLNKFLDTFVKPNTMYTEAGPVIETPLSCAASIHELLLQSWSKETFGTHIRVFPAVPDAWKDASFDKLLAEGAFEVSASRRDRKTRFVRIKSLAGAPCRVSSSLEGKVAASGSREFKIATEIEDGQPVTVIDLKKGETVLLTSADQKLSPDDLVIEPVAPQAGRLNYYGSPKQSN
jgi:alpha-L-fucosidase 2